MTRFTMPLETVSDASGNPGNGWKLAFYVSGTTTPATTYSNAALSTPNSNPVIANANGRFSDIFLTPSVSYKVILLNASDVVQWTADPISSTALATADLAGLVKASSLSSNGADLQAIMDKLAGTVNAASISNTVSDQQAITDKLDFLQTGTGAVTRSLGAKLRDVVSIKDFGAACDGTTDDTAAWNAALATGRDISFPASQSRITGKLSYSSTWGQRIIGDGNYTSIFVIDSGFNLAATAVIQFGGTGQQLVGIGVSCAQTSTAVRGNLRQYPWIVRSNAHPSTTIRDVWINASWNGILLEGNCGQSMLEHIRIGGFNIDIYIDGALDTVRLDHYHSWPFDFPGDANLMSVYEDGTRVALTVGRCDDLCAGSILSYHGKVQFGDLGNGVPFGTIARLGLDGKTARIEMSGGRVTLASAYGSGGDLVDYKIQVSGNSALTIAAFWTLVIGPTTPDSWVSVIGAQAHLAIGEWWCEFQGDARIATVDTSGYLTILGGTFVQLDATARTQPVIHQISGRLAMTGCRLVALGGGTGNFVFITVDDKHVVTGNDFGGFGLAAPGDNTLGCYGPNTGLPAASAGAIDYSYIKRRHFTGSLSGGGAATIAHAVTNLHTRMVDIIAVYVGGSGERIPMTVASVDSTNITLSGGGAAAVYHVWVSHG